MWSSPSQIKSNIASFKRFYKFLLGKGVISKTAYNDMIQIIKEEKDNWIRACKEYDESIAIYIGAVKGSSKAAKSVYAQIMDAVDLLCEMPDLGKQFGDSVLEVRGYRTYLAGNYRIFYAHDEETLIIWRIVHVRQDIDDYGLVKM